MLMVFTSTAQTHNPKLDLKLTYLKYKSESIKINIKDTIIPDHNINFKLPFYDSNLTIQRYYINEPRSFYFFRFYF